MNTTIKRVIADSITRLLPDALYLSLMYRYHTGKRLNLSNPVKFSEKIQWLKLNGYKDHYDDYVDKFKVREIVRKTVGEDVLIPLYGVYLDVSEIEWDLLPRQFVLKCTHGSGCNIVCTDKNTLDVEVAKRKLKVWMDRNWFWYGRERPYLNLKPRIICERFLSDDGQLGTGLTDYKFYCFDGSPEYCQVIMNRCSGGTIDFFDTDWNHMPFSGLRRLPSSSNPIPKPAKLKEMLEIASTLSTDFPFLRVDLYYAQGQVYFGELTFYPASGFGCFVPDEWNDLLGERVKIKRA